MAIIEDAYAATLSGSASAAVWDVSIEKVGDAIRHDLRAASTTGSAAGVSSTAGAGVSTGSAAGSAVKGDIVSIGRHDTGVTSTYEQRPRLGQPQWQQEPLPSCSS